MKTKILFLLPTIVTVLVAADTTPPKTRTDNVKETLHGVTITDPYRWLEDQDSPETRAWIDEQARRTDSMLGKLPGRDQIRRRLEQLLKIDSLGAPIARGGRYFYTKRRADQNLSVIYMRVGRDGKEEALVDPHTLSRDQTVSVGIYGASKDGKLLAYSTRQGGEDEVSVTLLDVDTRKPLADKLPRARYFGLALKPDRSGFYYSKFNLNGSRIYYHAMGADAASDAEIFGQGTTSKDLLSVSLSDEGRYLVITVAHGVPAEKVEIHVQDLQQKGPLKAVVTGIPARFYGPAIGGKLYLLTNWKAPNQRVVSIDLANPAPENWRDVVPESSLPIRGFSAAGGKLFVGYMENVVTRVKIFEPSGKHVRDMTPPSLGTAGTPSGQWESDEAFYLFTSFAEPTTIYRYQISTGKQDVWSRSQVPVASDQIEVKQVWFNSRDKTRVPMFVVHRKGLKLDGQRPVLLTGYGGFNSSQTPVFSSQAAFWVERGGVFALPSLRGGGEFGEKWHEAGMFGNKQNVFDDFIAAAEWLIENGYTRASKLAIRGGSNGGLLVGAAVTQRPELFGAVVCGAPLLDMIRYQRFKVARWWVSEYGSSEDPKQFEYLLKYSPYHNVKDGAKYPAVLFTTGDSDTRVDPLHARKMAARMQAASGSGKPILLHYDTKAGHSGGMPVSKQIEDLTDVMSFLLWQLGE